MIRTSTAIYRLTARHLAKRPTLSLLSYTARSMSTSNAPAPGYETDLSYSSARSSELGENLRGIRSQISSASSVSSSASGGGSEKKVQLVAVSKLKPASDILCLHREHGHAAFGENYVQELLHKAKLVADAANAGAKDDGHGEGKGIEWHFIGGLQSNKCKQLAHEAGLALACVQTVDTAKKATELNKGRQLLLDDLAKSDASSSAAPKLEVYVQVNTSGEDAKSGTADAKATLELARHIATECSNLQLRGLMTIGSLAQSTGSGSGDGNGDDADAAALAKGDRVSENADFTALVKARDELGAALDADAAVEAPGGAGWKTYLRLSMGMSADFETAIRQGADTVRVGSALFGARPPKQASKQVEVDTAKSQT